MINSEAVDSSFKKGCPLKLQWFNYVLTARGVKRNLFLRESAGAALAKEYQRLSVIRSALFPQDYFQHKLTAEVCQHQTDKTCQGPANGCTTPPAQFPTADQQGEKNKPCQDG